MVKKSLKRFQKKSKVIDGPDLPKPDLPEVVEETHPESDSGDIPESEANAMVERATEHKRSVIEKALEEVDQQDWTRNDPVIPADFIGKVWIAVYRCPKGHKTKATNRQAKSGVLCFPCKLDGKNVKADLMAQFSDKPAPADDDSEKRKKAKKYSQ